MCELYYMCQRSISYEKLTEGVNESMLETFRLDTFEIGDKFKVLYEEDQYIEIVLVRAEVSKYQNPYINRIAFSLIFTGEKHIYMESGTYTMEQEKVGRFEIGISPILPLKGDTQSHYFEAVFS